MKLVDLENEVKTAMRNRDQTRVMVLRGLVNRIKMMAKNDGNREVRDDDLITNLQKAIREVEETRSIYLERNVDTAPQDTELAILREFLPKQLVSDVLENIITTIVDGLIDMGEERNRKLTGRVMQMLKERHRGEYDARMASEIVTRIISG